MILHIWGDQAAAPQHCLHFGYGVGSIISPQLARPFLSQKTMVNLSTAQDLYTTVDTVNNQTLIEMVTKESRLMYPYSIGSTFVFDHCHIICTVIYCWSAYWISC